VGAGEGEGAGEGAGEKNISLQELKSYGHKHLNYWTI